LAGYDNPVGGGIASDPMGINVAGEWKYDDWKGLFTSWDALYFFSGDPDLREEMLTNADLSGRFPIWYREADHYAGSGQCFDAPATGHVDPYGRVISVNARQQFTASLSNWQPGCKGETSDNVNTLTPLNYPSAYHGWRALNTSHIPHSHTWLTLLPGNTSISKKPRCKRPARLLQLLVASIFPPHTTGRGIWA
jgi:hypothetical protein